MGEVNIMEKSKSQIKRESELQKVSKQPAPRFRYICQACSKDAILTSNKMIGAEIECKECHRMIALREENFVALLSQSDGEEVTK